MVPRVVTYPTARPEDGERVAQLHADSWRRTYRGMFSDAYLDGDLDGERREVWLARLARPADNQFVCLAVTGAELAGFVCVFGADDPQWGSLIDNLHVARAHQKTGIGAALMGRAARWLERVYADRGVYLWVLEGNRAARRFYHALGAANAGAVENEVHPGHWNVSCRYVWSSPALLARAAVGRGGHIE